MGKGKSMNDLLRVEEEDGGVITARENLFGLIEWVIDTAASNYPVEFQFHRDRIAALLFKNNPRDGDGTLFKSTTGQRIEDISTIDKDIEEELPLQHIVTDSVQEQERGADISEIKCEVGKPCMGLDREADRLKLEASKRKLHQGYQEEIDRKRSRKIQVIELNNLPACKPSSCQKAPRQRCAAANPKRPFGYRDMHKRPAVIRKRC